MPLHPISDGDEKVENSTEEEEANNDEDEEDDDNEPTGRRRNRRKYDSDQSYRQSPITNRSLRQRAMQSDDSDTALARPTRSAAKRLKASWGQEEDSLEAPHDDEVTVPQQPSSSQSQNVATSSRPLTVNTLEDRRRRSRRKIFAEDEDAEGASVSQPTQAASSSSSRSFRSARLANNNEIRLRTASENVNGHHEQNNDDDNDDDSDDDSDQVLSQLAHHSSRFKRKNYRKLGHCHYSYAFVQDIKTIRFL